MESYRILAYILFVLVALVLPLMLIGAAALMVRVFTTARPGLRRAGLRSFATVVGLALFDLLMLKALPWLGLSYGPIALIFLLDASLRGVTYVIWGGLVLRGGKDSIRQLAAAPLWAVNIVLALLLVYGFYIEPFNLQATHIQIPVARGKLSQPVRIVHLTDIHVERTTRRERALAALVQAEKPDLILMTGDYLNLSFLDDPTAIRDARDLISKLSAPYGIYAVNGSVDNEERMQALFTGLNVRVLADQTTQVQTAGGAISLVGVSDGEHDHDMNILSTLTSSLPESTYHILLYHTPDLIKEASTDSIDLYLAGHTHGGQVRLPLYGAIITYSMFEKEYEMGRYQVGNTTLYVSRGIGMEGSMAPRARFLAPPEVVVLDLIPTP